MYLAENRMRNAYFSLTVPIFNKQKLKDFDIKNIKYFFNT